MLIHMLPVQCLVSSSFVCLSFFFALGSMRSSVHVRLRIKPLRIYPGGASSLEWEAGRGTRYKG